MSLKVGIQRRTGSEENMIVEVVGNPDVIRRELSTAYRIMDERAWVMFTRTAEGMATLRKLAKESPAMYLAMMQAMRFLFEGEVKAPEDVSQYAEPKGDVVPVPAAEDPSAPEPSADQEATP